MVVVQNHNDGFYPGWSEINYSVQPHSIVQNGPGGSSFNLVQGESPLGLCRREPYPVGFTGCSLISRLWKGGSVLPVRPLEILSPWMWYSWYFGVQRISQDTRSGKMKKRDKSRIWCCLGPFYCSSALLSRISTQMTLFCYLRYCTVSNSVPVAKGFSPDCWCRAKFCALRLIGNKF